MSSLTKKTDNVVPLKRPQDVTNRDFLQAVFGEDADRAWVTVGIPGDKPSWFGMRAADCDVNSPAFTQADPYVSVGIVRHDAPTRAIQYWSHTRVITLDDVTEKVTADAVRAALGEPSYILRTSWGSQQWGYILSSPLSDPAEQDRIMRALTIGLYGGKDPGHMDNVRYVRLPRGFNSKPARVKDNGGWPQPVALLDWHPERKFDVLDLMMALDELPGLNGRSAWAEAKGAGVRHRATPEGLPKTLAEAFALYLPRDYILAAFDKLDRVVGMQGSQGYIEVKCPFNGHPDYGVHTNDDDRTGWNPSLFLDGRTAFQCFHSDGGADRSNKGIEAILRAELDARDGEGSFDALKQAAMAATFGPLPDAGTDTVETKKPERTRRLMPLGATAPTTPPAVRPSICSFMARGEVTAVAGQPGTGKSALIIGTALAIAAGRPDLIGERDFERTGDVIIVSKEDDYDALHRRRNAWLKAHGIDASDLRHEPHFVEDPDFTAVHLDNSGRPVLTDDMDWLGKQIAALNDKGRNVCAVVLDTLSAVMDGLSENDNGMMGRATALLSAFAVAHGVAVLVPHHMPKGNGRDGGVGDLGSIRGASAIGGGVRLAVTLSEPDDRLRKKLTPDVRDRVVIMAGAKANHDAKAPLRYFLKQTQTIDMKHEDGRIVQRPVVTLIPYKPNFGWEADSDNAKITVLTAVAEAEKHTTEHPEGNPLRIRTIGDKKGAADLIAEQEDADDASVEKTIKIAFEAGLLERGKGPRSKTGGHRSNVWRLSAAGAAWMEARARVLEALDEDAPGVLGDDLAEPALAEPALAEPALAEPALAETVPGPTPASEPSDPPRRARVKTPAEPVKGSPSFDDLAVLAEEYFAAAE